ncbi:MAG: hypothetical protein ABQ298_01540 [Puniceicoccaceae bacterium]
MLNERTDFVSIMNTAKVIEEIKQLPLEEQGKVVDFLNEQAAQHVKFAEDAEVEAAAEAVFEEHAELFKKLAQ